jgi:hypothetical protein
MLSRVHLGTVGLIAALLVAVGCVTPAQNRQDGLIRITREYNDGLRWRRYQDVTPHLATDEAQRFLARTAALSDDFEMADDEISSVTFQDNGMRADVAVEFTWYSQRRALVRRTLVAQDWRFQEGRWVCAAQRRVRGDRFPLIPEPMTASTAVPPPRSDR